MRMRIMGAFTLALVFCWVLPASAELSSHGKFLPTLGLLLLDEQAPTVPSDLSHFYANNSVSEQRQAELDNLVLRSPKQPATGHPRLYGNNAEWLAAIAPFENLDPNCEFRGSRGFSGSISNIKWQWDKFTRGGVRCENKVPATLASNDLAKFYMSDGAIGSWNSSVRLRTLHLIRRLLECHARGSQDCLYPAEDTQILIEKFVAYEVNRLRNLPRESKVPLWAEELGYPPEFRFIDYWHKTARDVFDLGAEPAFRFWTLFLDILWDHAALSDADQSHIEMELDYEIRSYRKSVEVGWWNVNNGNNWTLVLNTAALYWAILNWHERPSDARDVLSNILAYNWRHRPFYTADGGYLEGGGYLSNTTYPPIRRMNMLLLSSFGQPLHALPWFSMSEHMPRWYMDSMSSDGYFVDFGDLRTRFGHSDGLVLDLLNINAFLGLDATDQIHACNALRFFANVTWDYNFETDIWSIPGAWAQDWYTLTAPCTADNFGIGSNVHIYPDYGLATLWQHTANATTGADLATDVKPHMLQADVTMLSATTTDSSLSHREIDTGGVIWSAYGSRLLFDYGYGIIAKNYRAYDTTFVDNGALFNNIDNNGLGANTLVVPEAVDGNYYYGQVRGAPSTVSAVDFAGIEGAHMDLSDVYGASTTQGKLQYFHRWVLSFPGGHYLLADSFRAKDGVNTSAQEFWMTSDSKKDCSSPDPWDVSAAIATDKQSMDLTPRCYHLANRLPDKTHRDAESRGRIIAASLHPGEFVTSYPSFFPQSNEFKNQFVNEDNGMTIITVRGTLNNDLTHRKLIRFVPDAAVNEDVRVFLLQAGTPSKPLQGASVVKTNTGCAANEVCFDVSIAAESWRLVFSRLNNEYRLNAVR